jgi:hypothetical protein
MSQPKVLGGGLFKRRAAPVEQRLRGTGLSGTGCAVGRRPSVLRQATFARVTTRWSRSS